MTTETRTLTLTLTRGQYDALANVALEAHIAAAEAGADAPDLASARDLLDLAWADAGTKL